MANNIRDYTSIYSIKDFILNDIAPKYFDMDDISLLNVGMFGMATDIAGTVIEDNFRTTSRFITETLPGQSRLPEFIYANAANYGISNIFSTCSKCDAVLFIKEDDIINNAKTVGDTLEYIIDSDTKIFVEDIPYALPYNIKIKSRRYNGSYHHNCMYDESISNSISEETSPYVKCVKTRVTGETKTYLALTVRLYQYEKKRTTESIITNSTLNIPYIDISFSDSLCNFEVLYTSKTDGTTKQLLKYLETVPATTKPFTYYKMQDEGVLRLTFTNDDRYFIPEYNSELEILMYETKGSKGVFKKYTGTNIYVEGNSDDPELAYNKTIPIHCIVTSDSLGGTDTPSLEDLRLLTWDKQLTINSYTTETDLNQHFSTYATLHKCQSTFIKTRDDFIRVFSCHTRLQDDDGNIFPTNTLPVIIDLDKIGGYNPEYDRYTIKPGTPIGYKDNLTGQILTNNEIDNADIVYTSLALMTVEMNPNSIQYHMNSINKTVPMEYEYINEDAIYQFICNKINVVRNAVAGDDSYNITVTVLPSDLSLLDNSIFEDESGDVAEVDTLGLDDTEIDGIQVQKIKVFLFFNTNIGHYLQLDYDSENSSSSKGFVFSTNIKTNDLISGDTIEMTNLIACTSDEVQVCSVNMTTPDVRLLVLYDNGSSIHHEFSDKINPTKNLTLTNTFTPKTGEMYFAYPMSLMQSTISFEKSDSDAGFDILISDVPLFLRSFLLSNNNLEDVTDRINSQHEFLLETLRTINSNFSIQLKFFNTYGHSRIFSITNGDLLNRTNCSISMGIKFVDNIDPEQHLDNIKNTIKEYIQSLNDYDSSGVNSVDNSVLIQTLHNTYSGIIRSIILYSINGYDSSIQNIYMNKDMASSSNKDEILEFLTIDIENINITIL